MKLIRLAELRNSRGWTIDDVSIRLNIARSTYAGYEYGRRDVPNEMLVKIAELYNVTADYILGLTDDPHIVTDLKWQDIDEVVAEIDPEIANALKVVGAEAIMLTKSLIESGLTHEQLIKLLEAVKNIHENE